MSLCNTTICRIWSESMYRESDTRRLNDQDEYLKAFTSRYHKMELRLEAYEKTQVQMDDEARYAIVFAVFLWATTYSTPIDDNDNTSNFCKPISPRHKSISPYANDPKEPR